MLPRFRKHVRANVPPLSKPGPLPYTGRMELLVQRVAAAMAAARRTLATAESCTGGLVGAALTAVPGSSAWYLGGAVAYSNALKTRLLGVPEDTLAACGAVSAQTARAMADGIRRAARADYALAITGIAGPGGGTPAKPVGLVYLALAGPAGTETAERRYSGDRAAVRAAAAADALRLLLDALGGPRACPPPAGRDRLSPP